MQNGAKAEALQPSPPVDPVYRRSRRARLSGGLGYFILILVGLIGLAQYAQGGSSMYEAAGAYVTSVFNSYFILVSLSLLLVSYAWLTLPERRVIFIAAGLALMLAFLVYTMIFALLPGYWFSILETHGFDAVQTLAGLPSFVIFIATLLEAVAMVLASRIMQRPWFLPTAVSLIASTAFAILLYQSSRTSFVSIFGSAIAAHADLLGCFLVALTGILGAYAFMGQSLEMGPSQAPDP